MSTVAQLADRVTRDWLFQGDDQPVVVTLAAAVDDSTQTWTYDDATLAEDEEDLLAPGIIVECDSEQARITAVDDETNTLTVVRGVNGTTAASHVISSDVTVAPAFSRHAIVEAVKDNVASLYPSLWHIATETVTTDDDPVDVPAAVITGVEFRWQNGSRYPRASVTLLPNFPPSATDKAIQIDSGVPTGKTGYFTYRSKFTRPTAESDELADLGVDATWERIVAVGAAAQVVGGRPQDALTSEYLTEQLERESLPSGAVTDIRNGLLTLRNVWLDEATRALRAEMSVPVVYRQAFG